MFNGLPRLAGVALEVESHRLHSAGIPQLFARDLVRVPPTLNDDLLELYGRSEQVLSNRFGFFGETVESDAHIAWGLPRNSEWLPELHAFDFALDLALTFRISGDERYGRHLRYLIAEWISGNPPGRTAGWKPIALARRIHNWTLAADLARETFEAKPDFLDLFTRSLAQQVTYLSWMLRDCVDRRARLMSSRALLLASRYFSGSRAMELSEIAQTLLALAVDEGWTSFPDHPQPLRQFELASACLDHSLFGNADANREFLEQCLETLEGMLHPDGTLPLFGREPLPLPDAISALFSLGASVLSVPRWKSLSGGELGILSYMLLGEAGKQQFDGLPQEPWHATFHFLPETGIIRLGDGKSSAMLITATPPKRARDHRDLFSYELTLCGQRTVVDSGIAALGADAGEIDLAAAVHHNVLLVDGRPPEYDSMQSIFAAPVEGQAGAQGLWLSQAWLDGCLPRREGHSCVSPLLHRRGFFLLAERFWVVLDYITGSGANRVESLIHFYPVFSLEVQHGWAHARSGAASVVIQPAACDEHGARYAAKLTTHREGRTAPFPGVNYPSRTLSLEWRQVMLPAVFGYIFDTERLGTEAPPAIALSRAEVRLTLGIFEFSIRIPGGS